MRVKYFLLQPPCQGSEKPRVVIKNYWSTGFNEKNNDSWVLTVVGLLGF